MLSHTTAHCWRGRFPEEPLLSLTQHTQTGFSCTGISQTLSRSVRHLQHVAQDCGQRHCVCLILNQAVCVEMKGVKPECAGV